jgi:hypothetical protein
MIPREQLLLVGAIGAGAAWMLWRTAQQTSGGQQLAPAAAARNPLTTLRRITPEDLIRRGGIGRPGPARSHRVRYPAVPGMEIQRLMQGGPMACATAVPRAERGWLFAPPSEMDY